MKVIVLGNGFDLGGGLPTSYGEFFKYRIKNMSKAFKHILNIMNTFESIVKNVLNDFSDNNTTSLENKFVGRMQLRSLNKSQAEDILNKITSQVLEINKTNVCFWDIYFWYLYRTSGSTFDIKPETSWHQIETKIREMVLDKSNKALPFELMDKKAINILYEIVDIPHKISYSINPINSHPLNEIFSEKFKEKDILCLISKILIEKRSYFQPNLTIYEYLLLELEEFEKTFKSYISQIMKKVNSNAISKKCYRDNFIKIIKYNQSCDCFLINFNYTSVCNTIAKHNNIATINRSKIEYKTKEINVHGKYNSITLFGIDQAEIEADFEEYIFTKTYRKILNQEKIHGESLPNKTEVDELIFYGHSLSDADYSYFQSLFDYYDIYQSDVLLSFRFSLYGDEKKYNILKANQLKAITRLLTTYGKTMNNINHGKNLTHKLMLENRLRIDYISLNTVYLD